jgi:hypothetical protein
MPVRPLEVVSVLALVVCLLVAKHVPPIAALLPLTSITGIVCFAFAIYLALRIFSLELARIRAEE